MQAIMGKKYQSQKALPKSCWVKNSPKGCANCASEPLCAMRVVSVLKRSRSRSMPQKRGLTRLLRWANTVFRLEPLHSMLRSPAKSFDCTENDMSDGAVATFNSARSAIKFG